MTNKKWNLIFFSLIFVFSTIFLCLFLFFFVKGKDRDYQTNRSGTTTLVNRSANKELTGDNIIFNGECVNYRLPKNFYYQGEEGIEGVSLKKSYFNFNYSVMIDTSVCKNHYEDRVLMDNETKKIIDYRNIEITADEWINIKYLLYIGDERESGIQELEEGRIRYFTNYETNESAPKQGVLIGVVKLTEDTYFGVEIFEFDKEEAPDIEDYKKVFQVIYE